MAVMNRGVRLDFSADGPDMARVVIRDLLALDQGATRKVYAALAHKVWTLLIERRLDDELRDWHSLLQGVRTALIGRDAAAAERMVALSDLLRESISLAETSPARKLAERPQAKRILGLLARSDGYVSRRRILSDLGLKSAHLSNVLTQLLGQSLIVRRDVGKEAEFRLTRLGRSLIEPEGSTSLVGMAKRIDAILESRSAPPASSIRRIPDVRGDFGLPMNARVEKRLDYAPTDYGQLLRERGAHVSSREQQRNDGTVALPGTYTRVTLVR